MATKRELLGYCLVSRRCMAAGKAPDGKLAASVNWPGGVGDRKDLVVTFFRGPLASSAERCWWNDLLPEQREWLLGLEWSTVNMKSPLKMLADAGRCEHEDRDHGGDG